MSYGLRACSGEVTEVEGDDDFGVGAYGRGEDVAVFRVVGHAVDQGLVVKAVERVMGNLSVLRGPIAHCSPLADDEVVRLKLTVRDWFRLME